MRGSEDAYAPVGAFKQLLISIRGENGNGAFGLAGIHSPCPPLPNAFPSCFKAALKRMLECICLVSSNAITPLGNAMPNPRSKVKDCHEVKSRCRQMKCLPLPRL